MENTKMVFAFGGGKADGNRKMKSLLGGKGANLAEMSSIGLPIPPGFTISTEVCDFYDKNNGEWPQDLENQIETTISYIENLMGQKFGDTDDPLLFSVRSGAAVSMPGMMDTVLDLGLNDQAVLGLSNHFGNERFAYDCYRRFIDMFGDVVMGIPHEKFEAVFEELKKRYGVNEETELTVDQLKELVSLYKNVYKNETGDDFPQEPRKQLFLSINAVFKSWSSKRAKIYRKINGITGLLGTAVNVQTMVYGNMGEDCATGVCFTRNPSDGTPELYGEFLINAQGEDVVAGIRTPQNIDELRKIMPESYDELDELTQKLERHYADVQDIEFTIQKGVLYILQTRSGKRTGKAAIKIATDMVKENLVNREEAVLRLVEPRHLDQLLHPQLETIKIDKSQILGHGLPASPGAAVGKVVFHSEDAEKAAKEGIPTILVRIETSPEDVGGMASSEGILTSRGGMTSHAAVVARGWGKPCVAGCGDIQIDYQKGEFRHGDRVVKEGDWISIDGAKGWVIAGKQNVIPPVQDDDYYTFMSWVDEYRDMQVRTNADTPADAKTAIEFGAEGIGLCRTEHMFFAEDRILAMRKLIVSETLEDRKAALADILPFQRQDFIDLFEVMGDRPVTFRLLDPPLHEFLPETKEELEKLASQLNISFIKLEQKVRSLKEFNPMLGHRGCRLGITYPEITEMQVRGILEAAINAKSQGYNPQPEIMIPLVGTAEEFISQHEVIDHLAAEVFEELGETVTYKVGTMIEIPRAAMVAGKIAAEAEFFSFGTNDLTQLTYGYSRDDSGKFLDVYLKEGILHDDPFATLDQEGVGSLLKIASEGGRKTHPGLKIGICGEHGGDPRSVEFCYQLGLNYVSCSPFRVPVARLAAAQARINAMHEKQDVLI